MESGTTLCIGIGGKSHMKIIYQFTCIFYGIIIKTIEGIKS